MKKFTFKEGQAERTLTEWTFREDGPFEFLMRLTERAAGDLTEYHARLVTSRPEITAAEEREALAKGGGALESLHIQRRKRLDRDLAMDVAKTLGERERLLMNEVRSFDVRIDRLVAEKVAPWNDVLIRLDLALAESFSREDAVQRAATISQLQRGKEPELACAILRLPRRLLPMIDDAALKAVRHGVAVSSAPEQVAEITELRHAADITREAWGRAIKHVEKRAALGDGDLKSALGDDTFQRYRHPPTPFFSMLDAFTGQSRVA